MILEINFKNSLIIHEQNSKDSVGFLQKLLLRFFRLIQHNNIYIEM